MWRGGSRAKVLVDFVDGTETLDGRGGGLKEGGSDSSWLTGYFTLCRHFWIKDASLLFSSSLSLDLYIYISPYLFNLWMTRSMTMALTG